MASWRGVGRLQHSGRQAEGGKEGLEVGGPPGVGLIEVHPPRRPVDTRVVQP